MTTKDTKRLRLVLFCCLLVGLGIATEDAHAQELGRGSLRGGELGRASLDSRASLRRSGRELAGLMGGKWGTSASLCYADIDWDLGDTAGSEMVWSPELSFFYMVTESFDVRLGLKFASGKDESTTDGALDGEMLRFLLGGRYWIQTPTRLVPYVGAGVGAYLVNGDQEFFEGGPVDVSVDDSPRPGFNLHAGCGFLVSDQLLLTAEISYDSVMSDVEARIGGEDEDFSVSLLSFGIGVVYTP